MRHEDYLRYLEAQAEHEKALGLRRADYEFESAWHLHRHEMAERRRRRDKCGYGHGGNDEQPNE